MSLTKLKNLHYISIQITKNYNHVIFFSCLKQNIDMCIESLRLYFIFKVKPALVLFYNSECQYFKP